MLGSLLVLSGLDRLVAEVAADRGSVLELVPWDLVERLLKVLVRALCTLVPCVECVAEDFVRVVVHGGHRLRRARRARVEHICT